MNADEIAALVRQRIESRYRRLCFVHEELERLNALAKLEPAAQQETRTHLKRQEDSCVDINVQQPPAEARDSALANRSFEDFVFSRINFSVYRKIDTADFNLLFRDGLYDYEDSFYLKFFSMNREEVQKTIKESYVKAGPVYLCKKSGPLLLSIMRTVHTTLDFAPLLGVNEIADREQIKAVAAILDGLIVSHDDGMETKLFIPHTAGSNTALLCGTFYPLGKACTITLIPE